MFLTLSFKILMKHVTIQIMNYLVNETRTFVRFTCVQNPTARRPAATLPYQQLQQHYPTEKIDNLLYTSILNKISSSASLYGRQSDIRFKYCIKGMNSRSRSQVKIFVDEEITMNEFTYFEFHYRT